MRRLYSARVLESPAQLGLSPCHPDAGRARLSSGNPMPRHILDESHIHPAVRNTVARNNEAVVLEVQAAIARHAVVVVGIKSNPFIGKARKLLDSAGIQHHYLEYGSYLSQWRLRNALKMWTGWSTFPMVFVKGVLVGGFDDLKALQDTGELQALLA